MTKTYGAHAQEATFSWTCGAFEVCPLDQARSYRELDLLEDSENSILVKWESKLQANMLHIGGSCAIVTVYCMKGNLF